MEIRNLISITDFSVEEIDKMIKVAGGCVKFKPHLQLVRFIKKKL